MSGGQSIRQLVTRWADQTPESPAIRSLHGPPMTYAILADIMDSGARAVRGTGVAVNDRVAIVLPNGPMMATAFLCATTAATAAPMNPNLTEDEFSYYFADLNVSLVVASEDDTTGAAFVAERMGIPVLRVAEDKNGPAGAFTFDPAEGAPAPIIPDPEDVALVLHTSGTTARPKIVPLTQRNLTKSAANVARTLQLSPADSCLGVMPLFHIHGLVAALLASLHAGASVVCTPGFSAVSFLEWIATHQPTWYTAVPTMHQAVLARTRTHSPPLGTLRLIRSSSAALPPSVLQELESKFATPVIEAYGMTEAAHQIASNPLPPLARKPGSVGTAAGPEVSIVDEAGSHLDVGAIGEVVIRGSNVTHGYHGAVDSSEHFVDHHWFRTGDQGFLDDDGYLSLTGRLKEIINRGGETIAPREIDEVMLDIEGVRQAVAFAVPDIVLGEEVAAVVILDDGATLSEAEIQAEVSDHLSFSKVPKRIVFASEIPKGPTGKLQRVGLAAKLGVTSVRSGFSGGGDLTSPTGEVVAALWREVLEIDDVGLDEPFLESGGDSIAATALAARVEEEFAIDLPLLAFYNAATIRLQTNLIDELTSGTERPPAP